jgi:hypothetical protein
MVRFLNSILCCALTIAFTLTVSYAFAQQAPKGQPSVPTNPSSGENIVSFFSSRTPYEFWLTVTIGIIGLLVIILIIYAVRRIERPRPEDITRPIIVVTVIMGTLILITILERAGGTGLRTIRNDHRLYPWAHESGGTCG